ncbi:unnamed protein product [Phytophthora lilii]|uniref:Unnamed protein product n=1 Tax=Phytophthora lilii TaxID=2077276 RepID=A0A9W6TH00_9STRA|nr:unnamed protein product [Phytophthora lilii]
MVAVSALDDDETILTWGTLSLSDSSIVISDNVSSELLHSGFFDFSSSNKVAYVPFLSADDGAIAITNLESGDEFEVLVRGAISKITSFTTAATSRPGLPPLPTLDYATGGALHVLHERMYQQSKLTLLVFQVEGEKYNYLQRGPFDLQFTVEIGGLSPETAYDFYYVPLNDASACADDDDELPEQVAFSTVAASRPTPIQLIRSTGATGGGIHVQVKPPNDKGSDQELYYQIYMVSNQQPLVWTLMYNDTDISYWQTKLQKMAEYSFKATCMNEIGYSNDSAIFRFRTTLISPPGPPSRLTFINATGGMVQFSWGGPDDDGGSLITYYSVRATSLSGSGDLVQEVYTTEIYFGGLLANTEYEFKVYAGNSLGTGSDAGVNRFSTTQATLPSLPGEPIILEVSGGSATLAVKVPADTGGVTVDTLVCNVYANGVKVPSDAVRRLRTAPTPIVSPSSRRLSSRHLLTDVESFIYIQAGGLLPSTTYSFVIQLSNKIGFSAATNATESTTLVATVPGAPDSPTATSITGGAIRLSWSDPVDTGGVPLISYLLNVTRLGKEVGSCQGMILSCTVGNLLSITDYGVTLIAYNPVGASPPSLMTTVTTIPTSTPEAPQNVHVAEVSNSFVTMHWDACIDFGGGYVKSYKVDVVQAANVNVTFSASVPVEQLNHTIEGLSPTTDYTATVAEDDAISYILYRNGVVRSDNGEDITFEDEIEVGKTYSYEVEVLRSDGTLSVRSEATQFVATIPRSNGFDCVGSKGHIHWHDYSNLDHETWTITPPNQAGLMITVSKAHEICCVPHTNVYVLFQHHLQLTMFWLECDHDSVTISTITNDESVSYEGIALHYEATDPSDAIESITVPCPVSPSGLCSLNGACRKGSCSCFSGFVGESCSNAVICPANKLACTLATCDPVCLQPPGNIIAVSVNGDDTQGTGQLMDTSSSGSDPKAVQSLQRALELADVNQTILLYPGVYSGVGNCGVTVSISGILIRGLRGRSATILDCKGLLRGLAINSVTAQLIGLTFKDTTASTSGGAISATKATVKMESIYITNGRTLQNGGAIYGYQSNLVLTKSELTNCSAVVKGGAIYLNGSSLVLDRAIVAFSSARDGGGVYAQNSVSVKGDAESRIWRNSAAVKGGGLCIAGTFDGSVLNIFQNNALVGAGVAATSGSSTLTNVDIFDNLAYNDGGGIALLEAASLLLQHSPIRLNHAHRNGGGVFVGSNGTFENNVSSEITNCTAGKRAIANVVVKILTLILLLLASGGGFYAGDWTHPTVNGLSVTSSSAMLSGGCAAFYRSTVTLNYASFSQCNAPVGGGVYASGGSRLYMLYSSITGCQATKGGGVYINSSWVVGAKDASPSVVRGSQADVAAGGVFITGPQNSIQYFNVEGCSAPRGGGMAAQNTFATLTSVILSDNTATENGGGLHSQNAGIKAATVTVNNNVAIVGGGMFANDSSISGSILVRGNNGDRGAGVATSGVTILEGAQISANVAISRGGGISVEGGTLSIKSTMIQSCSAPQGVGGGAAITDADVSHYALTVQNCSSLRGGGIYANAASFYQYSTEESSSMSKDVLISDSSASSGGGLATLDGTACVVANANISFSTATKWGGGLFFGSGANCVLHDVRVTRNDAGHSGGGLMVLEATLYHSNVVIASNTAPTAGGVHVQSELSASLLVWWGGTGANKSRIYANTIDSTSGHAANVLLNCTVECVLSGTEIYDGSISTGEGAGIFICGRGNSKVADSLIANNTAEKGGGVAVSGAELTTFENVSFVGNVASDRGGGLWAESLEYYPELDINSCVFYNNSAGMYGGAISLKKVYVVSSVLLAVENHVVNVDVGSGGGLYTEEQASIMAGNWLFLSNDATIGGSIAGVTASEISLLVAYITRDSKTFFTGTWQNLFRRLVGFTYSEGLAQYKVGVQKGDLIYLSDRNSVLELLSSYATFGAADAGGGIYINANSFLYGEQSEISNNIANERGALLVGSNAQFVGNGGITSSGKNEGGGAISAVDGVVRLTGCALINNTALVGGAIHVDREGTATIMNSNFAGNTADQSGGSIATDVKAKLTIGQLTSFNGNRADIGGAIAVVGKSTATLTSVVLDHNEANENGGAFYIADEATLSLKNGKLSSNKAILGGAIYAEVQSTVKTTDSQFIGNAAFSRGGALYYRAITNKATSGITCIENTAPSGGCLFWITMDEDLTPIYPCESCLMKSNTVYDTATNTRDVQVMWWPSNVSSGVKILEPPDEESIEVLETKPESLESKMYVWPRFKAVDLYGQIEVLDNQTECVVSDGLCSEQTEQLLFEPRTSVRAAIGVISYRGASFTAANRTPEEGVYLTNVSCSLPGSESRAFVQDVTLLPCQPGYSINQG